MTIKWVKVDPLVMNGEPFCYATRLSVRNILEMRVNGMSPREMLAQHPELRPIGIAEAFVYATRHPERYAGLIEPDGSIRGPGFSEAEVAEMPEDLRAAAPGVILGHDAAAATAGARAASTAKGGAATRGAGAARRRGTARTTGAAPGP